MTEDFTDDNVEVTFDEVLAALGEEEANEFTEAMRKIQNIIDNPTSMTGIRAIHGANQLAALRTKIGLRAQYYKTQKPTMTTKRRKNLLLTMYNALEENINTLKLLGRVEASL